MKIEQHFNDIQLTGEHRPFQKFGTRADGDVSAEADLDDLAAFFAMSVVGISALLRANATPEQMYAASRGAVSVLDA